MVWWFDVKGGREGLKFFGTSGLLLCLFVVHRFLLVSSVVSYPFLFIVLLYFYLSVPLFFLCFNASTVLKVWWVFSTLDVLLGWLVLSSVSWSDDNENDSSYWYSLSYIQGRLCLTG